MQVPRFGTYLWPDIMHYHSRTRDFPRSARLASTASRDRSRTATGQLVTGYTIEIITEIPKLVKMPISI